MPSNREVNPRFLPCTTAMPRNRIVVRAELCTGCRACQVACVVSHEGLFGVSTARIHVLKDEPQGLDTPQVCRLCGRAPCAAVCPTNALFRHHSTAAVLLNSEDCTTCSACAEACPFDMIVLHPETGLPLICDLCGGEPACVKRCPTGAISYGDAPADRNQYPAAAFVTPGDQPQCDPD